MASQTSNRSEVVGVLTRTIVQSPVIRFIVHARIRHRNCNDVVFVGDNFIHVKQVVNHGPLQHIATKADFDTRIRAAKPFSNEAESLDEDFFIKAENDEVDATGVNVPPQCLALTLDSNDLVFLYLVHNATGEYRFVQQACPLPTFDRILFQPGEHLAVDPQSRALAVAANEREVVIYSAKSKERIKRELRDGISDWCPVSAQRPLQVDGIIHNIDFLIPSTDDQGLEDEDHIILLLIVGDERRTRAVWIDWYYSSDLINAQVHSGQPLHDSRTVPSLLIPLRNTSFLLAHGSEIKRYKDILTGSATSSTLHSLAIEPTHPGGSPKRPIWANWCRPRRGQAARKHTDHIYLAREDGQVYLIVVSSNKVQTSHAGDFGCHVGTAFASLGDSREPDILAMAGDMSSGRVQTIGSWFTPLELREISRGDAMEMEWIETIPNWATVTDMVTSTLHGRSQRSRDGVFVTSCRQPYGAITELRVGLEARLSVYFELDGLKSVTDLWALPFTALGHILLVLSSPAGTRLLDVSADAEMENIEELDDSTLGLDSSHQTLAAAALEDGKIVQITKGSICVTAGGPKNFEDSARIDNAEDSVMVAASIDIDRSIAITAERSSSLDTACTLTAYLVKVDDDLDGSREDIIEKRAICNLDSEPVCLSTISSSSRSFVIVASADSQLTAFALNADGTFTKLEQKEIPSFDNEPSTCDSITVLHPRNDSKEGSRLLAVCGLRNGRLYTLILDIAEDFKFGADHFISFSQSAVKLVQPAKESSTAYAMSGLDVCLLSWEGQSPGSLSIQSIWVTDKLRPELAQGAVVACTHMPAAHLLSSPDLANSLVMISGDEFLVTSLDRTPGPVPRQTAVNGTPSRLIYSEQQRCLVCASLRHDIRSFPSSLPHAKPEERRQLWSVIDFVPSRASAPSYTYHMQPGERVFSLFEWSFRPSDDKIYSFILVSGSYIRSDGSVRGRITFLKPVNKNWEVVDVKEEKCMKFDRAVYAMALLDPTTFVACVGQQVVVYRFHDEDRKWKEVCAPFKLASAGIHISTSSGLVFVSTTEDSLVTLELKEDLSPRAHPGQEPKLVASSMAPRADILLSHLVPAQQGISGNPDANDVTLMSTKYGQLIGVHTPVGERQTHSNSLDLLFEAQLPRSLTRLRQCNIRPRWKLEPPPGVHMHNIIGCAADGTLVGIALLDEALWRRLSWLQRLCEWSEELSPHSFQHPSYSVSERSFARDERAMPIGLSTSLRREEVVMRTAKGKLADGHIDGDVLARLLLRKGGGGETLKRVLGEVAERDDRVGGWVRAHLGEEIGAVDEIFAVLKDLLDLWL